MNNKYIEIKTNTEEEWLKERKNGLGASDLAMLLKLDKYSCSRKLYYDKIGTPVDYKEDDWALRRGKRLEPIARAYYEEKTGDKVRHGFPTFALEQYPFIRANVDGIIGEMERVVEFKVVGSDSFYEIKKNGLPEKYVAQLQYIMGILGVNKGAYGIYEPEGDNLLHFDVEFSQPTFDGLKDVVGSFWNNHVLPLNPPERLVAEDHEGGIPVRCKSCGWRKTCSGIGSSGKLLVNKELEF